MSLPRRPFISRVQNVLNEVAKLPGQHAYLWDERISLIAALLFHAVALLRLLSLLQWVKFAHRRWFARETAFQKRRNFHALYTELYFLAVIVVGLLLRHAVPASPHWLHEAARWASLYFALEAVSWTLYYLFFRHFVERSFTIYHSAEYFLAYPLALAVQAIGLASFLGLESATDLLALIFNLNFASPEVSPFWKTCLPILGLLYAVVLLSNLRDAFPKTQIKPTTAVAIIGAGDVVRQRLLPALVNPLPRVKAQARGMSVEPIEIHHQAVQVYDLQGEGAVSDRILLQGPGEAGAQTQREIPVRVLGDPKALIAEIVAAQVPAIIATPPDSHLYYLSMLQLKGLRFAVEKPISVFEPEIRLLLSPAGDALFADGFALSYYTLEKALPLTYLYQMNPVHRNYLDIRLQREAAAQPAFELPWNELMDQDAAPQRITLLLLEGQERSPGAAPGRAWTEDPFLGGLFYETAIHALAVLQKVLGTLEGLQLDTLQALVSERALNARSASFVALGGRAASGEGEATEVQIAVGKYMPAGLCRRGVLIEYAQHRVLCDFDQQRLHARPRADAPGSSPMTLEIQVREPYRSRRYAVQAGLIRTFFEHGWRGLRYDDFEGQRQVLKWLVQQRTRIAAAQVQMPTYDADGQGLPAQLADWVAEYDRWVERPVPQAGNVEGRATAAPQV